MKKFFAMLLAIVMLMALAAPAYAAEDELGSITINKISAGNVYEIYKLLDLESYDVKSGAYSYKINSKWTGFFETEDALKYVAIDAAGYVTWINGEDDASIAAFAKLALAYAEANGIDPVRSSKNTGEFVISTNTETNITSGKFSNLELGYYLVDSTMGALCGLTTTNPNASINAKNYSPTIDKQVKEDLTGNWGASNTADIGQIVEYHVTINVHAGAQNYVLHDVMSEGLTFDKVTRVEHIHSSGEREDATVGTHYSVFTAPGITQTTEDDTEDGCTLEVRFTQEFCDHLSNNDRVVVYYQAMLNRNAVIAGEGNDNTAKLEYGEDHETTTDSVKTKTFGFDLVKTDSQNALIDGAEFKIYDALTGGNEVGVVLMDDGVTYRRARADEPGASIVVKDGKVRVVGFDNGDYYLEETRTPAGYNQLTARQKFTISDSNLDAIFNGGIFSTGSGVHVVNKTGSMLPETGGLGTTIFMTVGGMMVLFAGVMLFTKKRMSQIAE